MTDDEFWSFFPGLSSTPVFDNPIAIVPVVEDYLILHIYPWAKKKDFVNSWSTVEKFLINRTGYTKKFRGPNYPQMLYALLRARTKKPKVAWEVLYRQANSNTLEGYIQNRGDKKTWTEESLRKYYHDNKEFVGF